MKRVDYFLIKTNAPIIPIKKVIGATSNAIKKEAPDKNPKTSSKLGSSIPKA